MNERAAERINGDIKPGIPCDAMRWPGPFYTTFGNENRRKRERECEGEIEREKETD